MGQSLSPDMINGKTPAELVNAIFIDWLSRTSKVLVNNVGSKRALEMVRPYSFHAGMAMILNIKNEMGVGDGYQTAGYAGHFGCTCIGIDLRTEFRESGTHSIVSSCGIENPTPELCYDHVVQMFTGFCNISAPEYEPVLLSSLAERDRVCEWVVKHKDFPVEQVLSEKVTAECLPPPLTKEVQSLWEFSYYSEWWMFWLKALIEYMGKDDAIVSMKEDIQESASSFLKKLADDSGPIPIGMLGIAKVLNLIDDGMHREGNVDEIGQDLLEKRITACPFTDAPDAVCHIHEAFNKAICHAIDPQAEFIYDRMITKGDRNCHWMVRKKEGAEKANEESAPGDLAKRLAQKYIDGEITEVEFEKKMANLKKHGLIK